MINKIIIFLFVIMLVGCSTQQPTVRTTKPSYKKPTAVVVNTPKKTIHTKTETTTKSSTTKTSTTNQNTNQNSQSEILEATTRVKVTTAMVLDYISKYKDVAKSNMKQYGIPSSIILGQGILESGAGTGPLSSLANNHFGIKCHKGWTGPSVKYDDDEAQECFRKYELPNESYKDHALFLTSRAWYLPLFELEKDDYKQWARGLKKAGYATDPKYPEKLIGIIERYQLNKYDSEVLGTEYIPINTKDQISLKSDLYQVSQGDTLYSISKKFNLTIEDLKKKNNIGENTISIGQNLIIK
jgi:flagellum-specific peptidoglycan hydrolase FlgJ